VISRLHQLYRVHVSSSTSHLICSPKRVCGRAVGTGDNPPASARESLTNMVSLRVPPLVIGQWIRTSAALLKLCERRVRTFPEGEGLRLRR